jgi:hypothetical protein
MPRIVGMIINFDKFTIEQIIENPKDEKEFHNKIEEAKNIVV